MKKPTVVQWVFWVLSLCPPILYLSMYLPIWNGKELHLTSDSLWAIVLFTLQCLALVSSLAELNFWLLKKEYSCTLSVISFLLTGLSFGFLCFTGFFFVLELLNIPWFPAQQ